LAPGEPSAQVPIEGGAGRSALTVSCGLRHQLVDDPLPVLVEGCLPRSRVTVEAVVEIEGAVYEATGVYAIGPVTAPDEHPTDPAAGYSSSNYLLLGLIIERVTGLTYAQAVRRDVLAGIGPRMAIQDAEIPVPPVATAAPAGGALPDGSYLPNRAWATALGAAGGIAADAPTLATWGYQLYGGHILTSETTRLMTTPVTIGYGLGTTLTNTTVGHPGLVPSYASLLTVIPADRISIAILLVGYMDTPALISLRTSIQIAMRT
jgi:CubicO group peptidase (beta-lactamase class C family)